MKRYLIPLVLLAFTALLIAPLAQTMRTANTTNDLVLLSPYTINTNTFVVTEGAIGDGTATIWTFVAGDVTGPDATHLQPLLAPAAGRWVKNTGGSGGTNTFNTLIVTNLYGTYNYFSNIYVTNLFVTNIFNRGGAKPMIKLGDTNIYITNVFVTINGTNLAVVNPTDKYLPYRNSATNFLDSYLINLANETYATNSSLRVARTGTFNDDGLPAQTFSVWGAGKNTGWQSLEDHAWLENNIQAIVGTNDPANSHSLTLWNQALADPSIAYEAENSLSLDWIGNAWSTNQALSHQIMFSSWTKGVAAADDPTGTWVLESKIAALAAKTNLTVDSRTDFAMGTAAGGGPLLAFGPGTSNSVYRNANTLHVSFGGTNETIIDPYRLTITADQNNNPTLLLRQNMTNTSSQGQIVFEASDADGIGDLALISSYEDGGWDVGVPGGRAGGLSLQSQYNNSLNTRLDIKGSSGLIQFWNRDHSGTNMEIANVSGYTGTGAKIFTDDGTFKSGGALTNAANWTAVGATDSSLAGTASVATNVNALNLKATNFVRFGPLTTAEKNALTPTAGDMCYDTTLGRVQMYDGAAWHSRVRLDGDTMTGTLGFSGALTPTISATSGFRLDSDASGLRALYMGGRSAVRIPSDASYQWSSTTTADGGADVYLFRDGAANTLALRNGVNAQDFRIYNTWSNSGIDYERGVLDWQTTANSFTIGTEMGGTGSSRSVQFRQGGTNIFYIDAATGALLWNTDGSRNIGANGANRPGSIYSAGAVYAATDLQVGNGRYLQTPSRANMSSPADGVWQFQNSATTAYAKLRIGGLDGGTIRVLTNSALSDFLWISVPNTNAVGGKVVWTLTSTDGTDTQQITGETKFGAVAKGTTVTPTLADVQCPAAIAGGGTLTAVIASNVTTNNVLALGVTPTSSLTTTNILFRWRLETPSTFTVNAL